MHVVDSSVWLEWFIGGENANQYESFLKNSDPGLEIRSLKIGRKPPLKSA